MKIWSILIIFFCLPSLGWAEVTISRQTDEDWFVTQDGVMRPARQYQNIVISPSPPSEPAKLYLTPGDLRFSIPSHWTSEQILDYKKLIDASFQGQQQEQETITALATQQHVSKQQASYVESLLDRHLGMFKVFIFAFVLIIIGILIAFVRLSSHTIHQTSAVSQPPVTVHLHTDQQTAIPSPVQAELLPPTEHRTQGQPAFEVPKSHIRLTRREQPALPRHKGV